MEAYSAPPDPLAALGGEKRGRRKGKEWVRGEWKGKGEEWDRRTKGRGRREEAGEVET